MKYFNLTLLLLVPLALLAEYLHWAPWVIFFCSALGIVPLAGHLGEATEALTARLGPRWGGFLNATLGNAAELIIAIFALRAGLTELVKASITGSIIGNILLVMGASLLLGGIKHGTQRFHREQATTDATLMLIAVAALAVPAVFNFTAGEEMIEKDIFSIEVSAVLMALYFLGLIFSFSRGNVLAHTVHAEEKPRPLWLLFTILLFATVFIAWLSEILVGVVEPVSAVLGLSEFFIGIILVPIVGNVAEHLVAVVAARKNQMDLSMNISMGSSLQVALFVGPFLVFLGALSGQPMDLLFNRFELAALGAAIGIGAIIALDGRSNWLEGAMLLGVYLILAFAFFYLPVAL